MDDASKPRPSPEELRRIALFYDYAEQAAERLPGLPSRCPCCLCQTLGERGSFEICPVCLWEDDGQDDDNAEAVSGVNGSLSLVEARANYRSYGASSERRRRRARPPRADELPESSPRGRRCT